MLLSYVINRINLNGNLISDSEFDFLEQCTRIRSNKALTYIEKEKYISYLDNPQINCAIVTKEIAKMVLKKGIFVTNNPKEAFFKIQNYIYENMRMEDTVISKTARIDETAIISPYNVKIGENCFIGPGVIINRNTIIEDDVIINTGTIIGGQSFTNILCDDGTAFLAKDCGNVIIRKGVEICGGCHIACGTLQLDSTILGEFTKLDAMVHVGHGTVIGKHTLIPAGAMISGNCVIGDNAWIGVNATISNRIIIGDSARVSLGSVVTQNVDPNKTVSGNFAVDHNRFINHTKEVARDNKYAIS